MALSGTSTMSSSFACSQRSIRGLSPSSNTVSVKRSQRPLVMAVYPRSSMSWQRFQAYGNTTETPLAVRSVPVRVAHDLLKAGHHYLDVRTPEEFVEGHVEGAVNVPFMYKAGTGMSKNLDFVAEVLTQFNSDDEIVVGCQSGKRSMAAATELLAAGFTGVTDMGGGYGAWVQSDLPTSK